MSRRNQNQSPTVGQRPPGAPPSSEPEAPSVPLAPSVTSPPTEASASTEAPLRTDGPTLEEYVAAGYPADTYPPKGYAPVESAPVDPNRTLDFLHLCNIAGHAWKRKTTPGGHWSFAECQNETCGKIAEVKRVGQRPPGAPSEKVEP